MSSRYQVTASSNASPDVQELAQQFNTVLLRISTDRKTFRCTRAKLPTDDSERLAIVTDDSPPSLNFFEAGVWTKLDNAP